MRNVRIAVVVALIASTCAVYGQDEPIVNIPFDTIPDGTKIVSSTIGLEGDVLASGEVESTVGFRFPDGTFQNTATTSSPELTTVTTNTGQYANRIVEYIPAEPVTEICFKNGNVFADIQVISQTTAGGNCLPGDIGWTIERDERSNMTWELAKAECLTLGMRLPEPFEFMFACRNAVSYGINSATNDNEWISNSATHQASATRAGLGVSISGRTSCSLGTWGWVASDDSTATSTTFRCVK